MRILTIGHSTHQPEKLLELLTLHRVTTVCDVRSSPYSRQNPQFNQEVLKKYLQSNSIDYVFLGKELGARSGDSSCYEGDKVQYERLAQTELFQHGLARLKNGARKYQIALMCAEKEPLECHRTILVSRRLVERGIEVAHIHADGLMETHEDALRRLARMLNLRPDERSLFHSEEEIWKQAYELQEDRIAYVAEPALLIRKSVAAGWKFSPSALPRSRRRCSSLGCAIPVRAGW
jgi:uncharacterized protein (DUF488 family)